MRTPPTYSCDAPHAPGAPPNSPPAPRGVRLFDRQAQHGQVLYAGPTADQLSVFWNGIKVMFAEAIDAGRRMLVLCPGLSALKSVRCVSAMAAVPQVVLIPFAEEVGGHPLQDVLRPQPHAARDRELPGDHCDPQGRQERQRQHELRQYSHQYPPTHRPERHLSAPLSVSLSSSSRSAICGPFVSTPLYQKGRVSVTPRAPAGRRYETGLRKIYCMNRKGSPPKG